MADIPDDWLDAYTEDLLAEATDRSPAAIYRLGFQRGFEAAKVISWGNSEVKWTAPMSLARLGELAMVDNKADRFRERWIDSNVLLALQVSPRLWIFNYDDLVDRWPNLEHHDDELLGRTGR